MNEELKRRLWLMAAGLAGGFITLNMRKQELTAGQQIAYLISALLVALFLTPWACEYFGIVTPSAVSGLAFVVGAFWQTVISKGAEVLQNWRVPVGGKSND
jgi:FtsH-binding integral membrane protein